MGLFCPCAHYNSIYPLLCFPLVDGSWNEWSAWSACSASCSNGTVQRTRECNGPSYGGSECHGSWKEASNCFLKECPGKKKKTFPDSAFIAILGTSGKYKLIKHIPIQTSWCVLFSVFSWWTLACVELMGQLQQDLRWRHPAEAESLWGTFLWWSTLPWWKGRAEALQWEEMSWLVMPICSLV